MTPLTGGTHPPRPASPAASTPATSVGRIGAFAIVTALVAVLGLITGGSAAATTSIQRTAPASTPVVPVMVVLDASGSMNQTDAPGPRIDAAKAAVTSLIDTLPAQAQVGLQVYGTGTGSTDAEKQAGCTDIKTLAPVAPLNAEALKAQVATVVAAGYTPIGNALRAAADALPNEGPRSIVLVSDGEDTCAPPAPCDVANELEQQGIDLTIHTVGFKVDPVAREQLSCIAQSTGGTYSDAADATALTQALAIKVDYAITGYTTVGTPVTGADQASEQAPLLAPGQYVDTFAVGGSSDTSSPGTTKYYTIPVRQGMRPYISATLVPPDDRVGESQIFGMDLDLMRRDLKSCNSNRGSLILNGDRNQAATGVLDGPTFGDKDAAAACPTEGVAILQVSRIGSAWADKPLQMEIVVRMEPPADATGLLPAASEGDVLASPTHGTPTSVAGGNSFNDAPRLVSGSTYSDTLVTGESRYFRVPVQWGQRMSYLITEVGPAQPPLGRNGSTVWVDTYNPVRAPITKLADINGESWFATAADDRPFSASTPYPARYTNRDRTSQRDFSLDGDYYVQVNADRNEKEPSSTGFLITVVVSGAVEPGPVYQTTDVGAGSSQTSPSATSSSVPSSSASSVSSSANESANSAAESSNSTTATGQTTPISESSVPGWAWAVAAVLAAGTVAALLVIRSRRRSLQQISPGAEQGGIEQGGIDRGGSDQPGDRHW